jgi:hypothetical protein
LWNKLKSSSLDQSISFLSGTQNVREWQAVAQGKSHIGHAWPLRSGLIMI